MNIFGGNRKGPEDGQLLIQWDLMVFKFLFALLLQDFDSQLARLKDHPLQIFTCL